MTNAAKSSVPTNLLLLAISLCLVAMPIPARAEGWTALDAKGISEALTGRKLQYETATQDFRASGKTLYTTGQDSWGNWSIRGNQYCSQWPPSSDWTCYDMYLSDDARRIRFVGVPDDVTDGRYID